MVRSKSFIAVPPGATIKDQLADRGMSQKEFAARMNMSTKHISKLVNGEVQLTPEVSIRLETVLGISAKFWNNLEALYREDLARVEAENSMDEDIEIARQFPYSEMAAYGWIPKTREAKEKVLYLRKYFEIVQLSLLGNEQITKIACRRLAVTNKSDLALMAWSQEAKIKARDINVQPINVKGLTKSLKEFRGMTTMKTNVFCPKLKRVLADNGIALVFLPHLKGSFLQGATFTDSNKIVVGLTARGRDADKFWFSFFHEMAHIILGHINNTDGTTEQDENDADTWAGDVLIPRDSYKEFLAKGDFSDYSICEFAGSQGIAPGIVVGRLQNDEIIGHNMYNELKEHYVIAG